MKHEVTCSECDKKTLKFIDHQDIKAAKWKIIGFSVNTGLPIVTCDTCEWRPMSGCSFPRASQPLKRDDKLVKEMEELV